MKQFDVIIVGGALSGSVLALALVGFSPKMRVAIIEKALPNYAQQGGFDARSIALAEGSLQKFAQITPAVGCNLRQLIEPIATPIKQIHVSDQGHFGKTTLTAAEFGLSQLGAVVELAKFGEKLAPLIAEHANIQLFCPNQVDTVTRTATECRLTLAHGEQLTAPLLVACDGIQSQLAQQCGVPTEFIKDYAQSAIIANVITAQPHHNQAFERFTAQGPFALLPLNDTMMSLVWCVTDPSEALAMSDSAFLHALQQQFGWKLGKFLHVSRRFAYPLSSQKAQSHIHHRLAIVGNAAQLLHPVAGQGFNLGLRDLFSLATLLSQAFEKQQDLGEYALLCRYAQDRLADQQRVIGNTDRLVSIFSNALLPQQIGRNLGLIALQQLPLARKQLAAQALGF